MMPNPLRETRIVVLLCCLAALRVFLLSAAFPFFNNVDEQSHFDLVYKYSRGHVPGRLERRDADAARTIVLYASPEYVYEPGQYPEGAPPRFRWPDSVEAQTEIERLVADSKEKMNFESTQPPLYYAVAGAWYRIGEGIGLRGGQALYWTRFLDVVVCAGLTWLAYVFARTCFPDRSFLRLGVPLLVAFFPQDAYHAVNNDVLLPLVNGAAFLCLVLIGRGATKSYAFYAGTGVLVAAGILVKFSSVALLPVSTAMVAFDVVRRRNGGEKRQAIVKGAVLLGVAAVPIAVWCARNYVLLGDVTGSTSKTQFLTWTLKPLPAMFDHPIFSLSGLAVFWHDTLARFWRGEFVWGLRSLSSSGWDHFYSATSFLFIVAAVIAPATWKKDSKAIQRDVLWPSLALFALSLVFLAVISVVYDFGECFYPSRSMPYVTSGRLALGALLPFVALYLYGLDALLPARLPVTVRWLVLIVPVAWMTLSELRMSAVAFRSAYNWFHMI
jgi:hypothetical protein